MEKNQQSEKPKHLIAQEKYFKEQQAKLKIDDTNLDSEFCSQATEYVKASCRFNNAHKVFGKEKVGLDVIEGEIFQDLKNGNAKMTVEQLKHATRTDIRWITQKRRVIEAENQSLLYQSHMRAWEHKKDMLIQLGSTQRAEFNAQCSIKK